MARKNADQSQEPEQEQEQEQAQAAIQTVKMERDGKTADVHPDEVAHMSEHGWVKVQE